MPGADDIEPGHNHGFHTVRFCVESRCTAGQVRTALDRSARNPVGIEHDEVGDHTFPDLATITKAVELCRDLPELLNSLLDSPPPRSRTPSTMGSVDRHSSSRIVAVIDGPLACLDPAHGTLVRVRGEVARPRLQSISVAAAISAIDPFFGPGIQASLGQSTTIKSTFHPSGCCASGSCCCAARRFSCSDQKTRRKPGGLTTRVECLLRVRGKSRLIPISRQQLGDPLFSRARSRGQRPAESSPSSAGRSRWRASLRPLGLTLRGVAA